MKKTVIPASLFAFSILLTSSYAVTAEQSHSKWGYDGAGAPSHWSTLDPANQICGTGKNQSPINLTNRIEADLSPIEFHYDVTAKDIVNNGHTVQINLNSGAYINLDNHRFDLIQMHFHAPSENHIDGKSFALEAHLVHADKDKNLAVVAIMYDIGTENTALASFWTNMPHMAGDSKATPNNTNIASVLSEDHDYYRFNGSLTTPPCSEGVTWLVQKQPQTISDAQLKAFTGTQHGPNNRPVQSVFARPILQ
ncbi:carbonic anhydrase [Thalassospira alkalitolerans]|uniref:carbonic anhydrase n=1 Tax=Thalassospira alkalitolerans TaxID=1293890 RepID=UPI003AA885AE